MAKTAKTTKKTTAKRSRKATAPVTISGVVSARTGNGIVITLSDDRAIVLSDWQMNKRTVQLAKVGAEYAPLEQHVASIPKPAAKLARGVDQHNSPHSAKAVRDARAARSSKAAKARGDAAAVAGKTPKAKKASGGMRGLAANPQKMTLVVKPKDSGLAAGSGRMAKLAFAAKCKTTADFLGKVVTDDNGKEHKCDAGALSGMVKRGHVRLG